MRKCFKHLEIMISKWNRKRIITTILCFLTVIIIGQTIALWRGGSAVYPSDDVTLIENESGFCDFSVVNDKVYIYCSITLKNNSDRKQYVELLADDTEDVETGLLVQSSLLAYQEDDDKYYNPVIVLSPNEKREVTVVFIGDFAGTKIKYDRLIPSPITVIEVS